MDTVNDECIEYRDSCNVKWRELTIISTWANRERNKVTRRIEETSVCTNNRSYITRGRRTAIITVTMSSTTTILLLLLVLVSLVHCDHPACKVPEETVREMQDCMGDSAEEVFTRCLHSTDYNTIKSRMCSRGPEALKPAEQSKGWSCILRDQKFAKCRRQMEDAARKKKLEENRHKAKGK